MYTETAVALDVETTGLNPHFHQITALAMIPEDGGDALEVFIDHDEMLWSDVAFEYFQKYRTRWEKEKIPPAQAHAVVTHWLQKQPNPIYLVGHNVGFDISFLHQLLPDGDARWPRMSHRAIDTASLLRYRELTGEQPPGKLSLKPALQHYGVELDFDQAHTAHGDALATLKLFKTLCGS